MKKTLLYLCSLALVFIGCLSVSSCSKDDGVDTYTFDAKKIVGSSFYGEIGTDKTEHGYMTASLTFNDTENATISGYYIVRIGDMVYTNDYTEKCQYKIWEGGKYVGLYQTKTKNGKTETSTIGTLNIKDNGAYELSLGIIYLPHVITPFEVIKK